MVPLESPGTYHGVPLVPKSRILPRPGQEVLLFTDNIFRFTQAGSEVSALLGRVPSAVGYQPTLANEMGQLQERITSTKRGSITSLQGVFVPADDCTDPAPERRASAGDRVFVVRIRRRGPGQGTSPRPR